MLDQHELKRKIDKLSVLLDKTTSRMQRYFGRSTKCVLGNEWEHRKWDRIKENESSLSHQDTQGGALLPTWPNLTNDLYSALRRTSTVLFDEDQIHVKYRGNRKLLSCVIETEDWERIHDLTIGDDNLTVIAALKIQEGWIEELKKQKEQADRRREQFKQEREERNRQKQQDGNQQGDSGSTVQPGAMEANEDTQSQEQSGSSGARGNRQLSEYTGTLPDNQDQEEGSGEEASESGDEDADGTQETGEYEPTPEQNNSIESYEAGSGLQMAMEAAQIVLEEAERLAERGVGGVSVEEAIEKAEAALRACEELEERIQDQGAYDDLMSAVNNDPGEFLGKAINLAVKETKEQNERLHAWGFEKGILKSMDPKEAMQLGKLLKDSENLRKIAELIGSNRITIEKRKVRDRLAHGPTVRVGIDQGRNLNKLVNSQKLMMVTSPSLFRWRYVNNNLQQYKTRMELFQERGTGVIWIDSSGSMWGGHPYSYSQVAKATAISLMEYFREEGRDCVVGLFDHGVRQVIEVPKDLPAVDFLKIKIRLATDDYGGGTSFYDPLMAGFAKIRETQYLESADQVLITDGQCYLSEEQVKSIKAAQEETRVNIITVLMPGGRATQMEQFGPVNNVSTALKDASKLALDIVTRMDDGYEKI